MNHPKNRYRWLLSWRTPLDICPQSLPGWNEDIIIMQMGANIRDLPERVPHPDFLVIVVIAHVAYFFSIDNRVASCQFRSPVPNLDTTTPLRGSVNNQPPRALQFPDLHRKTCGCRH